MRRWHSGTIIYVVLLAGMAVLTFGLSADPAPIGATDRAITKQGFLQAPGKWFGVTTEDAPGSVTGLREFANAAGKPPGVWMYWRDWSAPLSAADIEKASAQKVVPMIAWEPWTFGLRNEAASEFSLDTIIDGDWDELIDESAAAVVEADRTVVIRFAHEMNGTWYPWGVGVNGNGPGDYATAWRHVWERFEAAGANEHAIWVWSPNNVRRTPAPLGPLFPGDRYVDLVGMSGFLGYGNITETDWPDYTASFAATTLHVRTFTEKRFLITEMAALEKGTIKPQWIESVFDGIESNPEILGFLWFNIAKDVDWRITSSEKSRSVFASRVANGQYH